MDIKELQDIVIKFRDKRDWKQFHKPKDMALSLVLEAAEVLELFQWKSEEEADDYLRKLKNRRVLGEELSDALFWVLTIAHDANVDLAKAFIAKMKKNEKKYSVRKSKGKATKYTKL